MNSTTTTPHALDAEKMDACARAAHEANRAYCLSLGDHSQTSWEEAPQWQRRSAVDGVQAIVDDPSTTPEQSHEGWMKQKVDDGWVYGEKKDAEAKTHHCLVPYAELPRDQQSKDHIFGTVARAMIAAFESKVAAS